jgi:hypothetical protein
VHQFRSHDLPQFPVMERFEQKPDSLPHTCGVISNSRRFMQDGAVDLEEGRRSQEIGLWIASLPSIRCCSRFS